MTAPPESLMDAERERTGLRMGADFDSALPGDNFRSVWELCSIYSPRSPGRRFNDEAYRLADEQEHENE